MAHLYDDIQVAVSYIVLVLRMKIRAGDPDLGVITIWVDQSFLCGRDHPGIL